VQGKNLLWVIPKRVSLMPLQVVSVNQEMQPLKFIIKDDLRPPLQANNYRG
jgi:hypothetical protein